MKKIEITKGQRFGNLVVIKELEKVKLPSGQTNRIIECLCDCGNNTKVRVLHLVRNRILSCGCKSRTRNGMSKNPLLKVWRAIQHRTSEKYFERHLYFDKGIKVCDEWLNSHMSFINWAEKNGYKKGLQIDRIDNSKGYSPDNCRFVDAITNVNNRDVTIYVEYNNNKTALSLILREKNLLDNYSSIRTRILRGWSAQRAIDTPIRKGNYKRSLTKINK